ncbi:hypothetical protein QZH41_008997 [Actinostola sp. cb2023]|nr:hypothetical protein QZH41_008997 [Actinostola sp. cb2023]
MRVKCERLQDLCRRIIVQCVGSRRLVHNLPLPRSIIEWLKEYEEPTRFYRKCSTRDVLFSTDDDTITFEGQYFYSTTFIYTPYGRGYTRGKHEWVFYFDNCCGQVAVCLLPIEFKKKRLFGTVPYTGRSVGWAFNQVGSVTFEVPMWEEKRHYGLLYQSWDMIGMLLDLEKGTLGFMVNGKEFGVAFDDGLKGKEVFPAVCLCAVGEKATFVSSSTYL